MSEYLTYLFLILWYFIEVNIESTGRDDEQEGRTFSGKAELMGTCDM